MVTIKDIAKEAEVSIATVSRVINKSTKASQLAIDAVTNAMRKLGYRPNAAARALVNQSSNTVGILVSDVSDPFFGSLVKSVDLVAKQRGFPLLIGNGYHHADTERQAIEQLLNSRCEAIVVHAKGLSDKELIAYAKEVAGLVIINRFIPEISERCIYLDNHHGAYLATHHLIEHGHRHIACIASSHDIEDTQQRIAGYLTAQQQHHILPSAHYIEYGQPDSSGGEQAMAALLDKSIPITGVVAYNDYMAAGALSVLQQHQIAVPETISLVGFDDGLIARFVHPSLTTIHYPINSMAESAARLAISLARHQSIDTKALVYSPSLICRDSVQIANECQYTAIHQQ